MFHHAKVFRFRADPAPPVTPEIIVPDEHPQIPDHAPRTQG
jgi:hypothetical protein